MGSRESVDALLKIAMFGRICYTKNAAPLHSGNRREVSHTMIQVLIDFIVAVAAQVTAYYLCKWLNDHHKGK